MDSQPGGLRFDVSGRSKERRHSEDRCALVILASFEVPEAQILMLSTHFDPHLCDMVPQAAARAGQDLSGLDRIDWIDWIDWID